MWTLRRNGTLTPSILFCASLENLVQKIVWKTLCRRTQIWWGFENFKRVLSLLLLCAKTFFFLSPGPNFLYSFDEKKRHPWSGTYRMEVCTGAQSMAVMQDVLWGNTELEQITFHSNNGRLTKVNILLSLLDFENSICRLDWSRLLIVLVNFLHAEKIM